MGLQRELFEKLVPAKYPLALGLTPVSQAHASDARDNAWKWCGPIPPFTGPTGVYLWPTVDPDYWAHPGKDWAFTPIVLTTGDPGAFGTWHAASWTVFGRMFDSIDRGGDFDQGGLAIDEGEFMADHYGLTGNRYSISDRFKPHPDTSLGCPSGWPWD